MDFIDYCIKNKIIITYLSIYLGTNELSKCSLIKALI